MASKEKKIKKTSPLKIGEKVYIKNKEFLGKGTIEFIGLVKFRGEEYSAVGLRFLDPIGDTNGTLDGNIYFECVLYHGLFVRPFDIVRIKKKKKKPNSIIKENGAKKVPKNSEIKENGNKTPPMIPIDLIDESEEEMDEELKQAIQNSLREEQERERKEREQNERQQREEQERQQREMREQFEREERQKREVMEREEREKREMMERMNLSRREEESKNMDHQSRLLDDLINRHPKIDEDDSSMQDEGEEDEEFKMAIKLSIQGKKKYIKIFF